MPSSGPAQVPLSKDQELNAALRIAAELGLSLDSREAVYAALYLVPVVSSNGTVKELRPYRRNDTNRTASVGLKTISLKKFKSYVKDCGLLDKATGKPLMSEGAHWTMRKLCKEVGKGEDAARAVADAMRIAATERNDDAIAHDAARAHVTTPDESHDDERRSARANQVEDSDVVDATNAHAPIDARGGAAAAVVPSGRAAPATPVVRVPSAPRDAAAQQAAAGSSKKRRRESSPGRAGAPHAADTAARAAGASAPPSKRSAAKATTKAGAATSAQATTKAGAATSAKAATKAGAVMRAKAATNADAAGIPDAGAGADFMRVKQELASDLNNIAKALADVARKLT